MRFFTTPRIVRLFYPSLIWEMPKGDKKIYLTFDDGPHPTITHRVLELLKKFDAKATFFCVGNNVNKYKDTFELIVRFAVNAANPIVIPIIDNNTTITIILFIHSLNKYSMGIYSVQTLF